MYSKTSFCVKTLKPSTDGEEISITSERFKETIEVQNDAVSIVFRLQYEITVLRHFVCIGRFKLKSRSLWSETPVSEEEMEVISTLDVHIRSRI